MGSQNKERTTKGRAGTHRSETGKGTSETAQGLECQGTWGAEGEKSEKRAGKCKPHTGTNRGQAKQEQHETRKPTRTVSSERERERGYKVEDMESDASNAQSEREERQR